MNWSHLHLVLVHLPILGLPVGMLLALVGRLRHSHDLARAGLWMIAVTALLGLLAFETGVGAQRELERTIAPSDEWLEPHQSAAKVARIALSILAVAAIGTLLVGRDSAALPWLVGATALFGLVAALLVARAAQIGGRIRHSELRPMSAPGEPDSPSAESPTN